MKSIETRRRLRTKEGRSGANKKLEIESDEVIEVKINSKKEGK